MPEGDTIYKLAAFLGPRLRGRRLFSGFADTAPVSELTGVRIDAVEAQGKNLFIGLDNECLLRCHLGMWGSWHRYPRGAPWKKPRRQARILLDIGEEVFVCFNPKEVELLNARGIRRRVLAARSGPDLLAADDPPIAEIVSRGRELSIAGRLIADLLLDQRVAAGIGNVYKSETLFLVRVAPRSPVESLSDDLIEGLYVTARRLLQCNRGPGPRTTRSAPGPRLWVYGRKGQPCLDCGSVIHYARLGEHHRSTYWCPQCQAAS